MAANWVSRLGGARAQLQDSVDAGGGRLDRSVLTATSRERAALADLDWQLGVWAGLGDRRLAAADVESALVAYFRQAEARGARYGRVLGVVIGLVLIVMAAVGGVVVSL